MYKCIKTASIGTCVYIEGKEYAKAVITKQFKAYKGIKITEYFVLVKESAEEVEEPVEEVEETESQED